MKTKKSSRKIDYAKIVKNKKKIELSLTKQKKKFDAMCESVCDNAWLILENSNR